MAKDYLQFLRNETIFEDKKTAIQGLVNKLNSVRANGSPLIATYKDGEDGIVSILFGITYGDGKNYQIIEGSKVNSDGDLEIPDYILNEIKKQINLVIDGASDGYDTLKELEDLIKGLQKELDDTQLNAGLNENGKYSANTESNYISDASSLNNADVMLDAQIKENADAINAINSEITEIGNYTVNTQPISGNPVLNGGDVKLDGYEKSTGETTAIESGDTVNSAIGKLEKSIEDNKASSNSDLDKIKKSVGLGEDYDYVKPEGAVYITGATSVKEADKELDAQIKKNADAINTINSEITEIKEYATEVASGDGIEVSKDESGHTTTVSVKKDESSEKYLTVGLDGIKISGIDEAINSSKTEIGNYTVNTKPISGNPVLNGGDVKLDGYVRSELENSGLTIDASDTVNVAIGKLEKAIIDNEEVCSKAFDTVKTSVGLSDTLEYVAPELSNYLTNASSVKDADSKLDAQIKQNADEILTINSTLETIGNYTVNTKAISSNPVLNGGDVKLDGYEKSTGETAAIESGDTVNSAIGKLEKSIDDTNAKIAEVEENAIKVVSGNGINVVTDDTGHTATVSVKIDSDTEPYLTVDTEGLKVTGITEAINTSKTEIGNYKVNSKAISGNPIVNGEDIKLDNYTKSVESGETLVIASGDTVNVAIGKLEKSIEDNKVSVLATTGDSETAVMSQKAVTTETELVRYLKTKTTVETLQNLPTDYYLILANISGTTASLTVKGTMKDMQEIHIIVHNTNPEEMLTIVLPSSSNYINTTETSVSVLPNEYCEINMISDGTNTYIRAI